MITLKNGENINLSEHLCVFVNEYTGEVDANRKVLDKRVRKAWFRSEYPDAVIKTKVEVTSAFDKVMQLLQSSTSVDGDTLLKLMESGMVNVGRQCLATAEIYNGEKLLAVQHSLRVRTVDDKPFEYFTEAAINSAVDRCLIDLGFVIAGEYVNSTNPNPVSVPQPTTQSRATQALANAEMMIENSAPNPASSAPSQQHIAPVYDKSTPVEEILKVMDKSTARSVVFGSGTYKGKTVGEVYETTRDKNGFSGKLEWFAKKYKYDNVLVAACIIVNGNKH